MKLEDESSHDQEDDDDDDDSSDEEDEESTKYINATQIDVHTTFYILEMLSNLTNTRLWM